MVSVGAPQKKHSALVPCVIPVGSSSSVVTLPWASGEVSRLDAERPPPLGVLQLVVHDRSSDRHRVFALYVLPRNA